MELRHLRYFVAVAERLSFTAAAEALGVSQPPLSQQIRDLEAELRTTLLLRTSRRVELTEAGRLFLDHARAILAQVGQASEQVRSARAAAEAKRYLGFVVYLLVIFGTLIVFSIVLYARLDGDAGHLPASHFFTLGLVNALVLGKIMLLAEAAGVGTRAFGRRLRSGPLAYAILYRALVFALVLVLADVAEEVLVGLWRGRSVAETLPEIAGRPERFGRPCLGAVRGAGPLLRLAGGRPRDRRGAAQGAHAARSRNGVRQAESRPTQVTIARK
ncbi:LysR family transcriptional regulator [Methylobacterium nigriterrae]|uniref:LysR family transcriptional regulator n=1 Tax=Methylobacterium nigriterrae TaxID=3127512 RepID=UPI003D6656D6